MSMIGETTRIVRLPYPHAGQRAVRKQARRFNFLSAGRRWRKTTLLMSIMVEAALNGGTYIWGAPTFDQVRIGFEETKQAANGVADFNISRMTVTFPTNGRIIYRSLDDPDNARGFTADGVVVDEAGDVKGAAWHEVLRPMLIDTNGWAWLAGTPRGRNWFWKEHNKALYSGDDSIAWQIPTLGVYAENGRLIRDPHPLENPDIPFGEIEHLYQTLPYDIFRQEILAEFIENEGQVFRNIYSCLKAPKTNPQQHTRHTLAIGCDWGKHNDYTVFSVGCADCMREVELQRMREIDYALQRQRLMALYAAWRPKTILAESNAMGEPIIEQLQRDGMPVRPFKTTATTKPPLIESLVLSFEKEEMQFLDIPWATAELEAYERVVSGATGRSSYSAPDGMHDDSVIARALMRRAIDTSKYKARSFQG